MTTPQALEQADAHRLSTELAALVLMRAAPEELPVLDETAEEFFADPAAVLDPRRRDEALGFGIDAALLAPYVLAVVGPVVQFLGSVLLESVQAEVRPRIAGLVRRLFRRVPGNAEDGGTGTGTSAGDVPLSREQARRVRDLAYGRATEVGLSSTQAALLADSVVGALVIAE